MSVRGDGFLHDVFVSYAHRGGHADWVNDRLVPRLKEAGLKVAIDSEQFAGAKPVAANVRAAVLNSRRVLLVITKTWLASGWTNFEAALMDPQRIEPILLEPCDVSDILLENTPRDFTDAEGREILLGALIDYLKTPLSEAVLEAAIWRHPESMRRALRPYLERIGFDEHFLSSTARTYELNTSVRMGVRAGVQLPPRPTVMKTLDVCGGAVLVGDPGSGKTHTLRTLARTYGRRFLEQIGTGEIADPLPIFVSLARAGRASQHFRSGPPNRLIHALIADALTLWGAPIPVEAVGAILGRTRALLIFDGINEMPDPLRKDLLADLADFRRGRPGHLIVVSTRSYYTVGYINRELDLPLLELNKLRFRDETRDFLLFAGPDSKSTALLSRQKANDLVKLLERRPDLRRFAENPLLLSLLAELFGRASALPETRAGLLGRIVDGMLAPSDTRVTCFPAEQKHALLETLALDMKGVPNGGLEVEDSFALSSFQRSLRTQPRSYLPKPGNEQISEQTLGDALAEIQADRLLRRGDDGRCLRFPHQTFHEYFAAAAVARRLRSEGFSHRNLKRYLSDDSWHEILALSAGFLADSHVSLVAKRLWPHAWLRPSKRRVALACLLLSESALRDSDLATRFLDRLVAQIRWRGLLVPRTYPWLLAGSAFLAAFALARLIGADPRGSLALNLIVGPLVSGITGIAYFALLLRIRARHEHSLERSVLRPLLRGIIGFRTTNSQKAIVRLKADFQQLNDLMVSSRLKRFVATADARPLMTDAELSIMLSNDATILTALEVYDEFGGPREAEELIEAYRDRSRPHEPHVERRIIEVLERIALREGPMVKSRVLEALEEMHSAAARPYNSRKLAAEAIERLTRESRSTTFGWRDLVAYGPNLVLYAAAAVATSLLAATVIRAIP